MKLFAVIVLCFGGFCNVVAQNEPDTLSTQNHILNEIIVKGDNIIPIKDGIRATPTKAQRSTSVSGFNLLFRMQIPMLSINPATETATFITGESVSYFINGVDASLDDIKALKPEDIKNIEVMRNPQSLAFDGAIAVVNYIVRRYNYGGYASVTAIKDIFYDLGDFRLFTKYSRKSWTLQLSAGMNYLNTSGDRTEKLIRYDFNDGKDIFSRYSDYYETQRRQRQYYSAIQGVKTLNNGGFLLLHAGWRMFDNPQIRETGSESFRQVDAITATYKELDVAKSSSEKIHAPICEFRITLPCPHRGR